MLAFESEVLQTVPGNHIPFQCTLLKVACECNAFEEDSRSPSYVPSHIRELAEHNCEADLIQSSSPAFLSYRA